MQTCRGCRMISYCNREHRREHLPQHKTLCEAIKDVLSGKYMNTAKISFEEWTVIRNECKNAVSTKLQRCLKRYETQMFWFPKACVICYRQNELTDCDNCPASFCNKHKNRPEHTNDCEALKLCFEIDIVDVERVEGLEVDVFDNAFHDMTSFLETCVVRRSHNLSTRIVKTIYSEYLTKPLTLLFAMKQLNLHLIDGNLVVHVIASRLCDITDFISWWEVVLHEMPLLMSITIISIGPNLKSIKSKNETLCDDCIKMKKKIVYEYYPMFYRVYVRTEDFKKPDVIVGFNVHYYKFYNKNKLSKEWMASARALMKQNCPYILTLLMLLPDTMKKRANTANCIFAGNNPFMSLRPHRCVFSDNLCYNNHYLMIYKNIKYNSLLLIKED